MDLDPAEGLAAGRLYGEICRFINEAFVNGSWSFNPFAGCPSKLCGPLMLGKETPPIFSAPHGVLDQTEIAIQPELNFACDLLRLQRVSGIKQFVALLFGRRAEQPEHRGLAQLHGAREIVTPVEHECRHGVVARN